MALVASHEDIGLSPSASSSSRLNYLSLSSRRLRHISQKHTTQRNLDGLDITSPPLVARSALETTISRLLYLLWLPVINGDVRRSAPRTRTQRLARGLFFLSTWFSLFYFTSALCSALQRTALGWRDMHASPGLVDPMSCTNNSARVPGRLAYFTLLPGSPDSILATLSLEHRLSKLTSLYPVPLSFSPFELGPRRHDDNPVVACIWAEEHNFPRLQAWASSWLGPISLLVTSPGEPHGPAHKELLASLTLLSQAVPNISFHILHRPASLRNFNAYINLARLFSPSSQVLLFPPHAMSSWSPLPVESAVISSIDVPLDEGFVISMHERKSDVMSNSTAHADLSRTTFLLSSALLLHRDAAPWCSERLFTMTTRRRGFDEPSALDTEMAAHWGECVWNVWLRMKGSMRLYSGGWAVPGAAQMAQLPPVPETAETSLRVRIARKERSETCVIVARELIAQGDWIESPPAKGSEYTHDGAVSTAVGVRKERTGFHRKESSKAQWLRNVCKETLDRWGKEILE